MNKVYITAYSSISTMGIGMDETINNFENKKYNLCSPTKEDKFKKPYFPVDVSGFKNNITRSSKLTLKLLSLLEDKWIKYAPLHILLATSTGGIKETEEVYTKIVFTGKKYPLNKKHYFYDNFECIKTEYKDKILDAYTFSTACSSAGHSLLHAYRFIKHGLIKKALVVGVDVLSITAMVGFDSLKLISPTGTRPLSKERDGLTLGEGGGIVLLESDPGTSPIAELMGVASNSDGFHLTAPNPEGTQQKECILKAIEEAGITLDQIEYINAHGTGTPTNDEVEIKAIMSIFKPNVIASSLKGFIGHTLGSSAITELGIILGMLEREKIYIPENMATPIDENYIPKSTLIGKKINYFLKNSFGFGGNNVSYVVKRI